MEKENFCGKCKYFEQHYVKSGKRYIETYCGHCIFPRVKFRASKNIICGNFEAKK